ncbi:MAG: c-type cytochrome [Bacteroidota bacterium]
MPAISWILKFLNYSIFTSMFKYLKISLLVTVVITIAANSITPSATDHFENLKVLPKDITNEQLDSVMDHFKASLGVKCSFCHSEALEVGEKRHLDFSSDTKEEKLRAREMLQMTAYLNATYFNPEHSTRPDTIHEVICYTCHRGTSEPDAGILFQQVDSIMNSQHQRKK